MEWKSVLRAECSTMRSKIGGTDIFDDLTGMLVGKRGRSDFDFSVNGDGTDGWSESPWVYFLRREGTD